MLRTIPGTDRSYHLIAFDRDGVEQPDHDGSSASAAALADLSQPGAGVTDVFLLGHGWQGDYDDAVAQYDRWLGAADPDALGDGIRPFVIGVHWPSKAWSDRELTDGPDHDGALTVDGAVREYSGRLGVSADDDAGSALHRLFETVARTDRDAPAAKDALLPARLGEAYRTIADAVGPRGSREDSALRTDWNPRDVFERALTDHIPAKGGLLGRLRDMLLTPLRQLTFWHMKDRARRFGEGALRDLLVEIMQSASTARVHLMGHSFGTVVVSGAVRGPGSTPTPPPRPVDSLFLVQGAVSLWAFTEQVPEGIGTGRGYFADVLRPTFVSGTIVATTSRWDYAVGRAYPLAVGVVRQFLLADLPKYGGLGTFGVQGVQATTLPALAPGSTSETIAFTPGTVYNVDASDVIHVLDGAAGAHNDLGHAELVWLGWRAALAGR